MNVRIKELIVIFKKMNAIKRFNAGAVIVFPKRQLLVQNKTHHKT